MNNYKEVKNYIHNELKITKVDIQKLIHEEIKSQITLLLNDTSFVQNMIMNNITNLLKDSEYKNPRYRTITNINSIIYDNVIAELCKTVHDNIRIRVGLKTDNLELSNIEKNEEISIWD